MPRCANGHDSGLALYCATCGEPVRYREAVQGLAEVPSAEVTLEETAVLFGGVPQFPVGGAFACTIGVDTKGERAFDRLTLKQLSGGAWPDYAKSYAKEARSWMEANGFLDTPHKMVVLDLASPAAVLTITSIPGGLGTVVVGVAADGGCTPVEQNATYVSLEAASRRALPMIVVRRGDVERMTYYTGEEGLVTGYSAFARPLSTLMGALPQLQDSVYGDARLGVIPHLLVGVVSASDAVYRAPSDAARALRGLVGGRGEGVSSAHLVGAGPKARAGDLGKAFDAFLEGLGDLMASRRVTLARGEGEVYDIVAVLGVEKLGVAEEVRKGYETIVRKDEGLGVEGLEADV